MLNKTATDNTGPKRVRITMLDLEKYGFTGRCLGCTDLALPSFSYTGGHSEACRRMIYGEWAKASDSNFAHVTREGNLEPAPRSPRPSPASPRSGSQDGQDNIDDALDAADVEPPPGKKQRSAHSS